MLLEVIDATREVSGSEVGRDPLTEQADINLCFMNRDEWRPPPSTWYHEAGHAVAAVQRGGHVDYMEFGGGEPETYAPVDEPSDQAFMIWAGPWAQVYFEDNSICSVERVAALFQSQSLWDWPLYEEAMDPRRAADMDIRGVAAAVEFASLIPDHPRRAKLESLPAVTAPNAGWHEGLTTAWPQIKSLAESLLSGESPVKLSNGQELVRFDDRDYWYDPIRVTDPRPR